MLFFRFANILHLDRNDEIWRQNIHFTNIKLKFFSWIYKFLVFSINTVSKLFAKFGRFCHIFLKIWNILKSLVKFGK